MRSIYDGTGNVMDYSSCINTVLDLPVGYSGVAVIRIEGESWTATGELYAR